MQNASNSRKSASSVDSNDPKWSTNYFNGSFYREIIDLQKVREAFRVESLHFHCASWVSMTEIVESHL